MTTIYGHLDSNRKVAAGDIVQAGDQIGSIGRKSPHINGGYDPHLHFGVRDGRIAQPGMLLFRIAHRGRQLDVRVAALQDDFVELDLPADRPQRISVRIDGDVLEVEDRDGKPVVPARILWRVSNPDFPLVGYSLSKTGWRDPIQFLREHQADFRAVRVGP